MGAIPRFRISGKLNTAICAINRPLTGDLIVEYSDTIVKSIELQLVRVETCSCPEGFAREGNYTINSDVLSISY